MLLTCISASMAFTLASVFSCLPQVRSKFSSMRLVMGSTIREAMASICAMVIIGAVATATPAATGMPRPSMCARTTSRNQL